MAQIRRAMPGAVPVEGREFLYVEVHGSEDFGALLDQQEKVCTDLALPRFGGAVEEKVRVVVPDKRCFLALSYKGDIDGWRRRFVSCCERTHRDWGSPTVHGLRLSDGSEVPFSNCDIAFEG